MEQKNVGVETKEMTESNSYALKGIAEVFYDPISLFKKIKESPTILVPYVTLAVISFIVAYFLSDLIMQMQLESPGFQEQLNGQELPESAKAIMKYTSIVGLTISMMLIPIITAAFALFFGNFVMGGKAHYKNLLSMMIYSEIIFIAGSLLIVPMALAKGSMTADLSLGFLVADQGIQSVAFTAFSKISLFHIWELIVAGIGLSIIYDFSRNKGYMLAVLSVGLLSLLHIGAAALGAMFS